MIQGPVLSIRRVLVSLGLFSIVIATALAGLGLLSTQRQLDARARVVLLERALYNHGEADAFMDDVRGDVMRALLNSVGLNREDVSVIHAELQHHLDGVRDGIAENLRLDLPASLHDAYGRLDDLCARFAESGKSAVELALTDSTAGAERFDHFRGDFKGLETLMDDTRDILHSLVTEVRQDAVHTALSVKRTIVVSCVAGLLVLALMTAVAVRLGHAITTDLARSREQAHHLALHDVLTGLPNRAFLAERLTQDLADARRHDTMLAMLCLDLDRFKQVNDTLGHPVGDALLKAAADRLRSCVRKSDTVARLGGDEFAIIQAPLDRVEEAGVLAQRIVETLSEPYLIDGHRVLAGVSVGVAFAPHDKADAAQLLKMADLALYRAKLDGRGMFRLFEAGMDTRLQARRVLELDLRRAVAMEEFELHYQPLVNLASGKVNAVEALVRWRHPDRGLVPPGEFIPLCEETNLILPIGAWVLRRACADAAGWPPDIRVAVNVSAAQFRKPGLVAAVAEALAAASLAPQRLELEITETALLSDTEAVLAVLTDLRAMGVRIAMDDFGTGYSSLSYLRSFPFDKIKIDRCFIKDIETNADCKAITRAIIGLGDDLGVAITAEGVETLAQLEQLRTEDCNQVQGYLLSRPVPASDVFDLIGRNLLEPSACPPIVPEQKEAELA